MRRLVVLLLVAAVVYWIIRERPTVSGLIDRMTGPLLGSKAAVQESEHNRVVSEAAPAIVENEDAKVAALKEGMKTSDVRQTFGEPDSIEPVVEDGRKGVRWTYRRIHRSLYFEENRLISIAIR